MFEKANGLTLVKSEEYDGVPTMMTVDGSNCRIKGIRILA